jgi:beta-galactosidase/beta-glucuronidase
MDLRMTTKHTPTTFGYRIVASLGWLCLAGLASLSASADGRNVDFNLGWKFHLGDVEGAEQLSFDATDWQMVRTPHDWAIAGPFDPHQHGYAGKLPWSNVGWYRKYMTIDARHEGSQVYLDFDGVMSSPKVFVNGHLAGEWDYGYTSFRVDLTPHIRFGRANVVAVRVDNRRHGTRWYPGAGIYRQAMLRINPPVHLAHDGTAITTPDVTNRSASVLISNEVDSHVEVDQPLEVEITLLNPNGKEVYRNTVLAVAAPGERTTVEHHVRVAKPMRWDVDKPYMYECITALKVHDQTVQRRTTLFGIRTFRFTADDGFHLNGRRVQLQGVNLHHDLGPLGAAFNVRAMERRLELLQDMGVNAVRTSHNPPAAAMLDLCDRMGILVWDELFDKWDETADRFDGSPSFEEHIARHAASFVRRDRNHPSVIAWSIGNEISNQPDAAEGKSRDRVAFARSEFLRHDKTRPVGMACHMPHTADTGILDDLDLVGWNYQERYLRFREKSPQVPIIYSETASALSNRGQYTLPLPTNKCDYGNTGQLTAYEMLAAAWADLPDIEFTRLQRDSYLAGEFVWTGYDYLGEPTPFERHARSSYFGIIDLAGFPKDRFYLYRSLWRPDEPTLHVAPHWTWPGMEGRSMPVMVYTNGDAAELFLNGRSLGKRTKGAPPVQPPNLFGDASLRASSSADNQPLAVNGSGHVNWTASDQDAQPSITADLGAVMDLRTMAITFPRESKHYAYSIEVSQNEAQWRTVVEQQTSRDPEWGGVNEVLHPLDASGRYVRIKFGECHDGVRPAIGALGVYDAPVESQYYAPTYDYRLRWNDVRYEPGELKAVAYKNGNQIAEQVVRTAASAKRLRLTPDRLELLSDGLDVCHVAIEAVDENGVFCPTADDAVGLTVEGPATIAAVGNGDPTSLAPFQSNQVTMFAGKAVVIIRPHDGFGGNIKVTAKAIGIDPAVLQLKSRRE